jgi:SAGA-associated factor 29
MDPDDSASEDPSTLLGSLGILSALRAANEADSKQILPSKSQRDRKRKADNLSASSVGDDRESVAAESPGGPSPKVSSIQQRLMNKQRAGSERPTAREASVKVEDVDSGADSIKGGSYISHRLRAHRWA